MTQPEQSGHTPPQADDYPPAAYSPPAGDPPASEPIQQTPEPVQRKKRARLIVSLSLAAALLLCASGGTAAFLLLRNAEPDEGASQPTTAVNSFLTAVYTDKDTDEAAALVCSAARDRKQIDKRVKQVADLAKTYKNPRFSWDTPVLDKREDTRAIVKAEVTMSTTDEKVSSLRLTFVVVESNGWRVCEVS